MIRGIKILAWATFVLFLSFACERNVYETENSTDDDDQNSSYTEDDSDYVWDSLNVTLIVLNGDAVEITGNGATYSGSQVVIDTAGTYQLTGALTDGQILVQAPETDTVKLILDNVDIAFSSGPAVYVESAARAILILNDSSENYLADASYYADEELNGTLYAKSDLAISGANGVLNVSGNYKDGIVGKDGLILASGTYVIDAEDDGIRGKDYLVINGGSYTINSGGDAIKSDNENAGYGYILIRTGSFNISSSSDGIAAYSDLSINDGDFVINCSTSLTSAKGLKAGEELEIETGTFELNCVDDAIHSNGNIYMNEGDFSIDSDDDGIHADNELLVENATITINSSLEGIEAGYITINGGTIDVSASDDGFNATQGTNSMQNDGSELNVTGGTITVTVSGNDVDAFDSNGDITITGGIVYLYTPTSGMSEALDANGTITVGDEATVYENGELYTGSDGGSNTGPGGRP